MVYNNFLSNDWGKYEFETVNLGDKRRNKRLAKLVQERSTDIHSSISSNCGSWGETKAAYRFYENDSIDIDMILLAHKDSILNRIDKEKTLLAIQDTTLFNYEDKEIDGLGVLNDCEHFGFLLHNNLLYTTKKLPIGVISQEFIVREPSGFGKSETRYKRTIEEKESSKWLNALRKTHEFHLNIPDTEIITVADRECDIYDYFLEAKKLNETILVRAAWDRLVEVEQRHLWTYVETLDEEGELTIDIPIKDSHKLREVNFSIKHGKVTLLPPLRRKKENLEKIEITVVYLKEKSNNDGICWLLIINKEVTTFEEACKIVDYYSQRWSIEIFHKILKSGCRILERQFKDIENIKRFITTDSIAAIRIQLMTMLGRVESEKTPCTIIFEEYEWQSLYCFVKKCKKLPEKVPSLREIILLIAKLGGFLERKNDKEPGIKSMWQGMERFYYISEMWKTMKEIN